ncbi:Longin-like_domain superfamily [Hexamita inflata]|uniref:Longin-like domain superfamily n=1 Tax=Hexamita inflata TaxID=28002 RepID=A0AA86P712_9EUKA|nr:Longin-like domain superfamily [Hexamita inflata]
MKAAALWICGHSDERLVQISPSLPTSFLMSSAVEQLNSDLHSVQVLQKEMSIYGLPTQFGHKIVAQITGKPQEIEAYLKKIANNWTEFLMNPFVDMKNAEAFAGKVQEFVRTQGY